MKPKQEEALPQVTLHLVFKAMMYVAHKEGIEVEQKFHDLVEEIDTYNDYHVMDMIDNLENVYELIERDENE